MPVLHRMIFFVALCVAPSSLGVRAHVALAGDVPNFNRDVRPILSGHCFKCHGPDADAREADLRLDQRESATKELGSGKTTIVPGKPDASELIRRILSNDPDEQMPPAAANKPLSEHQKKILADWIAAGAPYEKHWAFEPPRQSPLPHVTQQDWPRNAIDYFILARLEAHGLAPNPPADKHTLVRRVYLDLIGLPPTPEEVDAFVSDDAPDAYDRLVDRLLASPYYGERWARRWLDLARYADTNGYEKDRMRSIWPYRDWVINAINAGKPFDEFTIDQLAGDMLPKAGLAERIATGFHRNTLLNEEGGIDPLEFRFYAMVDRVNTTGTVWIGLTMGCVQCHTHKFDPIPQRDFYRTMAFLNNANEPTIDVPDAEVERQRQQIEQQIAALTAALPSKFPHEAATTAEQEFEKKFQEWLAQRHAQSIAWTNLRPASAASNLPLLTVLDDGSVFASGDQSKSDRYELAFENVPERITALRIDAIPDDRLPNHGPGRVYYEGPFGDFFLSEVTILADGNKLPMASAAQSYANGNNTAATAIDGNQQTGWSINGGQGHEHSAVFTLREPIQGAKSLKLSLLFERYYSAGLGRFRISVSDKPFAEGEKVAPRTTDDLLLIPSDQRTAGQTEVLRKYFAETAPELAEARKEIEKLQKSLPAMPTTLVMQERPATNPRPTFIHKRGEFLQPKDRVEPGLLPMFPAPNTLPQNRLEFARWLVSRDNPLVARVTMNRQWGTIFGRGIVRTTEDFGYQGESPTHSDLLDWLAVEFMNRGWSMKQMHRLIVTSATYRQSSYVSPEALQKDPDGKWLSRFPRVRLDAEMVRDAALRESGLLASRLGGPSVFPPQPAGVTSEGTYGALSWTVSQGADRYRRGLYTFSKRSAPYAMFATFDGPTGEVCIARREISNTPLQALTALNDEVFVETSRWLARSVLQTAEPTDEARAMRMFRNCLARPPAPEELSRLVDFVRRQREKLKSSPDSWGPLVPEADGPPPAGVDRAELAAWTLLARAVFNLDEAITKE